MHNLHSVSVAYSWPNRQGAGSYGLHGESRYQLRSRCIPVGLVVGLSYGLHGTRTQYPIAAYILDR
jgi:hypothetical protein